MKNKKLWLVAVLVCLVSVAVYLPALENGFVNWDDNDYVYNNPNMKTAPVDFLVWAFSTSRTGNWHPFTWLSLRGDYAFWRLDPMGYHLSGVLLHGLNTMLVVLLAGVLLKRGLPSQKGAVLFGASVVGVIFGLHPFHVESVAWISERKDVLYAFFWLISLLAYTGYTSAPSVKQRRFLFLLCFISFALSALSKPMAVTLPVVLLILDYYPFRRFDQKSIFIKVALLEKLPFFLLSGALSLVTIVVQKQEGAVMAIDYLSLWARLAGAVKALGFYLAKTVWPTGLVPFYPLDPAISLLAWENMLSLIVILSITAVSVKLWRRVPLFIAAWCYFLITLLPVLGIIQVGSQAMADRYMYLPMAGPLMIIGAAGAITWKKGGLVRYLFLLFFIFFSVSISVTTVKQISVWRNSVSLWEYVISKKPEATLAHIDLGLAYNKQGRTEDAINQFQVALQINFDNAPVHNHLGLAYKKQGRTEDAILEFITAAQLDNQYAKPHNNLGIIYFDQGRSDEAMKEFLTAIRIDPEQIEAHRNLGVLYIETGRLKDAVKEFQIASNLAPDNAELRENLEMLKRMMKRGEVQSSKAK
jgi:Flp pilus assembly protein TadD